MSRDNSIETWAAQILAGALRTDVLLHDDGSATSMYDLRVVRGVDQPDGAAEVVMAAHQQDIEFWAAVRKRPGRWIDGGLAGGWIAEVDTSARVNNLRARLPQLLRDAENLGITRLPSAQFPGLDATVHRLGIAHMQQHPTDFPGSIYILADRPKERTGGMVPDTGDCIADWASGYLRSGRTSDLRRKLRESPTDETHAVIVIPLFADAPFAVSYLVNTDSTPLPTDDPRLPDGVSNLWVFGTSTSGEALFWSPESGWGRHSK